MRLSAANDSVINILGAVFVNISAESNLGKVVTTKQLCYVATGVYKMILSREACVKLGMISPKFPDVGSENIDKSRTFPVNNVNQSLTGVLNDKHFGLTFAMLLPDTRAFHK